jgi:membrane fusion protein, epimerase transport system
MQALNNVAHAESLPEPDPGTVPSSDRFERSLGLLILALGFGGFFTWAALAPIDSAAVAHGVVTVEGSRKTIQHRDGGVVSEILVREGDVVAAGAVLVRLDDTEASAQLEMARSKYVALLAEEARLLAERDDLPEPAFPAPLTKHPDDSRVREAILGQQRVFDARRENLSGEINVLEQRIGQLHEQIRGLEGLIDSKDRRIALYREEIEGLLTLFDRQLGDKGRLREVQRLEAELLGEQAEHRSAIAAAKVRIGETELEMSQARLRFASEVVERLSAVETELADYRERIRAYQRTVERTTIRAPVSGAVVDMQVHTVDGVIRPGDKILEVIPEGEPLLIEARVLPVDIDRVTPGLEAEVRLTAFNTTTTPTVAGEVLTVSADRLVDPQTGEPYYLARIRVTEDGMAALRGLTLLPGMPADVMIKTGERTFFEYLIRPIKDRVVKSFRED